MSVLSGFYRASYSINGKRASFYARKAGIPELGRRTVVHEYPNNEKLIKENERLKDRIKDLIGEIKCLG